MGGVGVGVGVPGLVVPPGGSPPPTPPPPGASGLVGVGLVGNGVMISVLGGNTAKVGGTKPNGILLSELG